MAEELRTCRRTGCNEPAAASLSFRYETRQVWVTSDRREGKGTRYDLCVRHADTLTVPKGWHRVDERDPARRNGRKANRTPRAKPAPAKPQPAPPAEPADDLNAVQDRYARLLLELPQLAEQAPLPRPHEDGVGQLSIPVPERGQPEAIVVSLSELAGARRDRETLRR